MRFQYGAKPSAPRGVKVGLNVFPPHREEHDEQIVTNHILEMATCLENMQFFKEGLHNSQYGIVLLKYGMWSCLKEGL